MNIRMDESSKNIPMRSEKNSMTFAYQYDW